MMTEERDYYFDRMTSNAEKIGKLTAAVEMLLREIPETELKKNLFLRVSVEQAKKILNEVYAV